MCTFFLIFALIHRMWLLIRAASLKEFYPVPTIYFLEQKKKNIYFFFYRQLSISIAVNAWTCYSNVKFRL